MKIQIALVCLLLVAAFSFAVAANVPYTKTNRATFWWNAVKVFEDGSPVPAEIAILYVLYTKSQNGVIVEVASPFPETTKTVTFTEAGRFLMGVKALYLSPDGSTVLEESAISWSDDPSVCKNGKTFGIQSVKKDGGKSPARPTNLHK